MMVSLKEIERKMTKEKLYMVTAYPKNFPFPLSFFSVAKSKPKAVKFVSSRLKRFNGRKIKYRVMEEDLKNILSIGFFEGEPKKKVEYVR
jgi:hypothetical protein